ncbi:hypothetical protein BB559_000321 [Furculomyces boomerangus]|uniref:Ribosomal protein L10 n=2 Tax=Harpellales TaxID=61421 RepID=A0A2T9Z410_9FUNG|nr:hypothetical protein BB559_000830 [Furculomyces boomerangus]PVU99874.1 hypothetical protein BB559_000321 [Furculomyces boomerangus]PWA03396.1 hypothetical protein BB558_000441 [Smittium angustum]
MFSLQVSNSIKFRFSSIQGTRILNHFNPSVFYSSVAKTQENINFQNNQLIRSKPKLSVTKYNKPFSNRKQALFAKYEDAFATSPGVLLVQFINISADEWTSLRQTLRLECHGADAMVLHGGIATAVVRHTKLSKMRYLFKGPVFAVYWNNDAKSDQYTNPQGIAPGEFQLKKHVTDAIKVISKNSNLFLLGGCLEDSLLTPSMVKEYTKLPDISTLQSQIVGILQTPSRKLVSTLDATPSRLVSLLKQIQ